MSRAEAIGTRPNRVECMRAAGRAFRQIAIRLELQRRAADAASASPTGVRREMSEGHASVRT